MSDYPADESKSRRIDQRRFTGELNSAFSPFDVVGSILRRVAADPNTSFGKHMTERDDEAVQRPVDDDSDDPEICSSCNGSGQGQYDGWTCSSCNGKGVLLREPKSLEQLRFEARMDPENQPFRPCNWSDV